MEGIAFVEWMILIAVGLLYRKVGKLDEKVEAHEKDCTHQFAEGSKKMALLDERYQNLHEVVTDVKDLLKESKNK